MKTITIIMQGVTGIGFRPWENHHKISTMVFTGRFRTRVGGMHIAAVPVARPDPNLCTGNMCIKRVVTAAPERTPHGESEEERGYTDSTAFVAGSCPATSVLQNIELLTMQHSISSLLRCEEDKGNRRS